MSLLEIMVVITLIGLVTAAVGVSVLGALTQGQIDTARNQATELETAVHTFRLRSGDYPSNADGLEVLAKPLRGPPVLEQTPVDPWGRPYAFLIPGQRNPRSFDIVSAGPDRQLDTDDDIGNWPETHSNRTDNNT